MEQSVQNRPAAGGPREEAYTAGQVRQYDHDRYLTAIFAPASVRPHLFALYAFNVEIAKTREVVTEPLIGQMRLQWWRDALDTLYGGGEIAHEVARPLAEAIRVGRLDRRLFDRLIDAREADLTDDPPPDLPALETYAEATAAPLLALALQLSGDASSAAGEISRSIGTAWALTGLIRAVPFHARQHRLYLPKDMIERTGVRVGRLFDLKPDPALAEVVRGVGERALAQLEAGRASLGAVGRRHRSPLLLGELARLYLADLGKAGWNPFAPELGRGRPLAVLNLMLGRLLRY